MRAFLFAVLVLLVPGCGGCGGQQKEEPPPSEHVQCIHACTANLAICKLSCQDDPECLRRCPTGNDTCLRGCTEKQPK